MWQDNLKRLTMPIEQMNISLPPKMARFIRSKVKDGQYTNASEVVRDAVRHMQETEAARSNRALLTDFEGRLPVTEREDIQRSVKRGIKDIEAGQFEDYDAEGLRGLTKKLVAGSVKKQVSRAKAG
jgi:putative addiction module CopG family antidote